MLLSKSDSLINKGIKKPIGKAIILFVLNLLIMSPLLIYGGSYNLSIDSYGILAEGIEVHTNAFIGSYRFFGAFLYWLFDMITGHNPIVNSTPDIIVAILLMSAAVTALSIYIYIYIRGRFLDCIAVDFAVLVCVANVWFCNILAFPECVFITAVGVCLCFAAIICFLSAKKIYTYLGSALLLICATGIYQQFLCVFTVFIVALYSARVTKNKTNRFKDLFFLYIKPVIFIAVCALIYLASAKIISDICEVEANSRIALSASSIFENIVYYLSHQHSYLKGRGFFDTEIMTFCFIAAALVWAVLLVIDWIKNRHTMKTLFLGLSYCAAYASTFLPGIVSTSHAARAMFALFSVFALFTVGSLVLTDKGIVRVIHCIILVVVLLLNVAKAFEVEQLQKEQNAADAAVAEIIVEEIEAYEAEAGMKIENISYCTDSVCDSGTYAESALWVSYAFKNLINLQSDTQYTYSQLSDESKLDIFDNKEWDSFVPKEQLVFEKDTLYICCY